MFADYINSQFVPKDDVESKVEVPDKLPDSVFVYQKAMLDQGWMTTAAVGLAAGRSSSAAHNALTEIMLPRKLVLKRKTPGKIVRGKAFEWKWIKAVSSEAAKLEEEEENEV